MPKALKFSPKSLHIIAQVAEMEFEQVKAAYDNMVREDAEIYVVIELDPSQPFYLITAESIRREFTFVNEEKDDQFSQIEWI